MNFNNLEYVIGYKFNNKALLEQSLTHRSYCINHNERLEFIGDSILNFIISHILFKKNPKLNEGKMSYLRANLVNKYTLTKIANNIKLSDYLRLGDGELKSGGMYRSSILADAVEAIIGAIFIDSNFDIAYQVVEHHYNIILKDIDSIKTGKDAKTLLQEFLQKKKKQLPIYKVLSVYGEAHNQKFEVECYIYYLNISVKAINSTKKAAEQEAAALALELIKNS